MTNSKGQSQRQAMTSSRLNW